MSFRPLFPKNVPNRSVHKNVYSNSILLSSELERNVRPIQDSSYVDKPDSKELPDNRVVIM